ncbi:MAG TPA: hypothetical protein VF104_12125 [Burkholderiales bacterium]
MQKITSLGALLLSLMLLGAGSVFGDEPRTVTWRVLEAPVTGVAVAGDTPGGDSALLIELSNPYRALRSAEFNINSPLLVVFDGCGVDPRTAGKPIANLEALLSGRAQSPEYFSAAPFDPASQWRICAQEQGALINPGQLVNINVAVDFLRLVLQGMNPSLRAAVYQVDANTMKITGGDLGELLARYRGKQADAQLVIDLYYRLARNAAGGTDWTRGTYAEIFGDPGPDPKAPKRGATGDYAKFASVLPVNLESYRRKLQIPGLVRDDGGVMFKQTLEQVLLQGSSNNTDPCNGGIAPVGVVNPGAAAFATVNYTITGRFSTKWSTDHALHPGWGFKVQVLGNISGPFGIPTFANLGTAWVQSDGSWTLNVPASVGYLGGLLRVFYHSFNEYYAPMNQSESKYSWIDPNWNVTTTTFDVGHRYADTDGGAYNGVGELADAAMTMWSRLYWSAGINPVAAAPIKFFFPNTWDDCGDGSGVPWSCATFDGSQIWLIAAHGTQGDVVNHEMGHALNAKFWGGKRPANTGGSHNLSTCYPTRLGMTLFEGFANFIAAWVGYPDRNRDTGSFGSGRWALGWDAEQRTAPPNCTNGWENEVWVARTFWDLHDTHADGDDILWFVHPGAVISLYLANGVATSGDARDMRFYENIYRNAASPGHQGFISDIFRQNRM